MANLPLEFFKMGYVLLYRNTKGDWMSNAIEKAQRDKGLSKEQAQYTHVEISGGDEHSIYIRPPHSGVIDIRKAHAGRYIRLLRPKVYDIDPLERKRLKVAYMSATQANLRYDWAGIAKFLIPFMFHEAKAFFCSEGCATAIQHQFPQYMDSVEPYKVMPGHFNNLETHTLIWEGEIPREHKFSMVIPNIVGMLGWL